MFKFRYSPIVAVVLFALSAMPASAATINVSTGGTDTPSCGSTATPCQSVKYGVVTRATSGDEVAIGAGTFPVDNITIGLKNLDIHGAGAGQTTLDGQNLTNISGGGMFRFTGAGTTTATIRDLSFIRVGRASSSSARRMAIYLVPPYLSASGKVSVARLVNLTVSNVHITGAGSPENRDTGIYSYHNAGALKISDLVVKNHAGNAVLLEQHTGAATIEDSEFTLVNSDTTIFAMTYSQPTLTDGSSTVKGKLTIDGNGFNAARAVGVTSWHSASGPLIPAKFTGGVTVSNNSVDSGGSTGAAVVATNAATTADGSPGGVDDFHVTGNRFIGGGDGTAVSVSGANSDPLIERNNIRDYSTGVSIAAAADHEPSGAKVTRNQIVGNATGISNGSSLDVDATNNWWGCNSGPGAKGCDTVDGTGPTTVKPHVVLGISTAEKSPSIEASVSITASLNKNSNADPVDGAVSDGAKVKFSATGGVATPAVSTLNSGIATTTFDSSDAIDRTVSARFDNAEVTIAMDDVVGSVPGPATDVGADIGSVLECLNRDLVITNIRSRTGRVVVTGLADSSLVGRRVKINYLPTGSVTVASALVRPNGSFKATAVGPSVTAQRSGAARYRAKIGLRTTAWVKMKRRIRLNAMHIRNGKIFTSGRIRGVRRSVPVEVSISSNCGRFEVLGRLRTNRQGRFRGSFEVPPGTREVLGRIHSRAYNYRTGREFSTYSIARPLAWRE